MNRFSILVFLCLAFIPSVAFGSPKENVDPAAPSTQQVQQTIDENSIAGMKDPDLQPLARGCCSWHKGVCGCDRGRTVCCDGQYSPSCGC